MKIQDLSSADLLQALKETVANERALTVRVLDLLEEVDNRKLYLKIGYSSLFEFCMHELKYSESAAYRRILAMRARRDVAEVGQSLEDGRLSLAVVARAQSFVRQSEKETGDVFSKDEKRKLFQELENKSAREAERTLLEKGPPSIAEFKIVVGLDLKQKLDRLKELTAHQLPAADYIDLISWLTEGALKKLDPLRKATPTSVESRVQNSSPGQRIYLSAVLKSEVWKSAQGQCCYRDPQTKRRCNSRFYLQIDHIVPLAQGGGNELSNLQLLCRGHNQMKGASRIHVN